MNPAVKILTNDGAISDSTALSTAEARLAHLAEAIRNADAETKEPLLAAMRDTHNATKWGCGLMNLDACRIPGTEKSRFPNGTYENGGLFGLGNRRDGQDVHPDSRCPTNVILDEAAACLLDEQEAGANRFFYCGRATTKEKNAGLPPGMKNGHPCVKPLWLCQYLATLILPPARKTPRRLLVPFSGTGSEIIGALLAGWDEVVGIELDENYIRIAEFRIRHWITATIATSPDKST